MKKVKVTEFIDNNVLGCMDESINPVKGQNSERRNFHRFLAKIDNTKIANKLAVEDPKVSKYLDLMTIHYSDGEHRIARKRMILRNILSTVFPAGANSRNIRNVFKSVSAYWSENRGAIAYTDFHQNDAIQYLSNLSVMSMLPKDLHGFFRQSSALLEIGINPKSAIRHIMLPWLESRYQVKIEDPLNGEFHQKFGEMMEREFNSATLHCDTTPNPLLYKKLDGSGYVALTGALALYRIFASPMFLVLNDMRRRIRRVRNAKNEYFRTPRNRVFKSKDQILEYLINYAPRGWEENPNIQSSVKFFAKKNFPKGSLSAVEIEFVANRLSPIAGHEDEWENCGDCDGCNHCDENGDPDPQDCENPSRMRGNTEWLEDPFIQWTTDSSVHATRSSQITVQFQEVRCIQNINDMSRLQKLCNWMNSQKLEVNRSCGLHVHLDTRDMSTPTYNRKARRAQECVKNWMQFCVPFSRFQGSYCHAFSTNRWDRYRAVNTTAREKHNTIEFRLGSGSINFDKIKNWIDLCHFVIRSKGKINTIQEFMKSHASPELKAFVIARICRFYKSHVEGRNVDNPNTREIYKIANHEASKIPDDIHKIVKIWGSVGVDESEV